MTGSCKSGSSDCGCGLVFVFPLVSESSDCIDCFGISSCIREQDTRQAVEKLAQELEIQRQVTNRVK